jgi:two-component system, NarL family, response regulator NreC
LLINDTICADQDVILIVEDDRLMSATLGTFIRSNIRNCTIVHAYDGSEATAWCRVNRPSVVLMDIALPDIDGLQLTVKLKEALPHTPVIVVSSHGGRHYIEHARAAGAAAYVVKDHLHRDLLAHIVKALATSKACISGT